MKIYWHIVILVFFVVAVIGIGAPFLTSQNSWPEFFAGVFLLVIFPPLLWNIISLLIKDFKPTKKEMPNEKD